MARGSSIKMQDVALFPRGSPEREAAKNEWFASITSDLNKLSPRTRAVLQPFINQRVGPALSQAVGAQAGRPGASGEGILNNLAITGGFEMARELGGLQQEIERTRLGIPEAPSIGTSAAEGAVEGFGATGSPWGALAGAAGGVIKGREARKTERRRTAATQAAAQEVTPEAVGEEAASVEGTAREAQIASGAGARRQQNLEAAITASGLRDTGLGTLASIAAGVQVPVGEVDATFGLAMERSAEQAGGQLSDAFQQGGRDPIAMALTGLTTAFLAQNRQQTGSEPFEPNTLAGLGELFPDAGPERNPYSTSPF